MGVVLLLADVLEQLRAVLPAQVHGGGPRLRIRAGIVGRQLITHPGQVGSSDPFDRVQLFGMRRGAAIHPEALVEALGIDDQRVAFPPADRMAVVGRSEVLRMAAAIHINRPEGVRAADIEDIDSIQLGQLDDLDAVRRHERARHARRLTPRVRLELMRVAVGDDRARPRLQGRVVAPPDTAADPDPLVLDGRTAEQNSSLGVPGRWPWRTGRAASANSTERLPTPPLPALSSIPAQRHPDLDAVAIGWSRGGLLLLLLRRRLLLLLLRCYG